MTEPDVHSGKEGHEEGEAEHSSIDHGVGEYLLTLIRSEALFVDAALTCLGALAVY